MYMYKIMGFSFIPLVGVIAAILTGRVLYRGYVYRSRTRALKTLGIPILPHSWLFGHLPVLGEWRAEVPSDVHFFTFKEWLIKNCKRYFPDLDFPPPVIYLDIWPAEEPFAIVLDPILASQLTQTPNLPKTPLTKAFLGPLTDGIDIVSTEGVEWKTWRSRFNPGFSQRNLMAMLPELIQEVRIFTSELERLAGSAGKWGSVFQLQTKTTNLTFDIICRAALGMQFNEQRRPQPSPFKVAFMEQIFFMGLRASSAWSLRSMVRKPWDNMVVARNNEIIRDAVMPQIKTKFESDANDSQVKTIIDLAIKYVDKDDPSASREKPNADFVHKLIANLKAFLFAGHDTTASTICFMMKELQDRPDVMAKVRAEHDAVLGPEPGKAADVLQQSPHLLYSLPYTLGVIKETLRLHPLAGSMRVGHPGHYLTMPGSGTRYPTDDWGILMSTTAIGQNPEYWPRPNELIPERWTVPEGDPLHPVQANAWVPFSMGPRNCIGMELALIELRIVLVLVARRFEIEEAWEDWDVLRGSKATPNHKIDGKRLYMVGEGTVHPKDAMPVHVRLYDHRPTVSA